MGNNCLDEEHIVLDINISCGIKALCRDARIFSNTFEYTYRLTFWGSLWGSF